MIAQGICTLPIETIFCHAHQTRFDSMSDKKQPICWREMYSAKKYAWLEGPPLQLGYKVVWYVHNWDGKVVGW